MKYYIKLDGDLIVRAYKTNSASSDTSISKTKYDKVKWAEGKLYKYISKDIVVEDDPTYQDTLKKMEADKIKAEKHSAINMATFEHNGTTFSANQEAKNNWTSMQSGIALGILTFPLENILRDNNKKFYTISDLDEFREMAVKLLTAFNTPRVIESQKLSELENE